MTNTAVGFFLIPISFPPLDTPYFYFFDLMAGHRSDAPNASRLYMPIAQLLLLFLVSLRIYKPYEQLELFIGWGKAWFWSMNIHVAQTV